MDQQKKTTGSLEGQIDDLHKQLVQMTQQNNLLQYHLYNRESQLKAYEDRISELNTKISQEIGSCKLICQKKMRQVKKNWQAYLKSMFKNLHTSKKKSKRDKVKQDNQQAGQIQYIQKEIAGFKYQPLISIILPVYNTQKQWLREALESVLAQYYPKWELCICDDCSTLPHVKRILEEYTSADSRIKVRYLAINRGVAGASNAALELADGEFIGGLDHDDVLTPNALYEVVKLLQQENPDLIYSDEAITNEAGEIIQRVYRPDWSLDMLFSHPYFVHFNLFRLKLVREIGGYREEFPVSQDYDFTLRFTARTEKISHIPKILYHWRRVSASASHLMQNQVMRLSKQALVDTLSERGIKAVVEDGLEFNLFRVRRLINGSPLVSIIIPTKDKVYFLQRCIESIVKKTTWQNYEIIIVDNNSTEPATLEYLKNVVANPRIKVMNYKRPFSYSALNNWAVSFARGSQLLFLNNDTEVISPEWLTAMLEHAQRPEVGAVGAKLLGIDGNIQHAGVILGLNGLVDHGHRGFPGDSSGYCQTLKMIRNYSAVTAACLMIRKSVFQQIGGFDEQNLPITFNDVDLCLRLRKMNYLIVYTPYAELYHYESISRGYINDFQEGHYLLSCWQEIIENGDPYYNPNLALDGGGYYPKE